MGAWNQNRTAQRELKDLRGTLNHLGVKIMTCWIQLTPVNKLFLADETLIMVYVLVDGCNDNVLTVRADSNFRRNIIENDTYICRLECQCA